MEIHARRRATVCEPTPVTLTASSTPGVFTDDTGRSFLEIDQHVDRAGVLHMYREIGSDRTFFVLEDPKGSRA
jgi:hypothetical protein